MSIANKNNIIFYILIIVAVTLRINNIDKPILDIHPFRQTQTAITVQSYINEGVTLLNYKTPVLGEPFTIPFEFPFYQISVYSLCKAGVYSIDVAARIVNILYFLLSVLLLGKIVEKNLLDERLKRYTLIFYLFLPFSIFWSRTSMIEFCALSFSLFFLLLYSYALNETNKIKKTVLYIFCGIIGVLAFLIKPTTAVPYSIIIVLLLLRYIFNSSNSKLRRNDIYVLSIKNINTFLILFLIMAVCFCVLSLWVKHTDVLKEFSPYSKDLTSQALNDWNYGTIRAKLNLRFWKLIIQERLFYPLVPISLFLIVLYISCKYYIKSYEVKLILLLLCVIFFTILTFYNLYKVHDYYMVALLPIISLVNALFVKIYIKWYKDLKNKNTKILITSSLIFLSLCQLIKGSNPLYLYYSNNINLGLFFPAIQKNIYEQNNQILKTLKVAENINKNTNSEDYILYAYEDWTSQYFYYAKRKGLMLRAGQEFDFKNNKYRLLVSTNGRIENSLHNLVYKKVFEDEFKYRYYKLN